MNNSFMALNILKHFRQLGLFSVGCTLAVFGLGCGKPPLEKQSQPYLRAAFAFASAIPDEKDASYYQEQIVSRALSQGDMTAAGDFALRLLGWRRGVSCADVAAGYFQNGDRVNGEKWILKAENEKKLAEDWQRGRIAAQIARAWGKTGDLEKIKAIGSGMETGEDKWMAFVAYLDAQVRAEGLDAALKLAEENFSNTRLFDHAFMHPVALIKILESNQRNLDESQRERVFQICLRAMEKAPSSHLHALYEELITTCFHQGWAKQVEYLAELIGKKFIPENSWEKPAAHFAFKVYQAKFEAMAGRNTAALKILNDLYPHIDDSVGLGFERCALMGIMIQAHMQAGDEAGARRVYEKGLTTAYREANPRPRAMAYAELLMRTGESTFPMTPADRRRLEADLSRPWIVLLPDGKSPQG
jgi:hypothetical protein